MKKDKHLDIGCSLLAVGYLRRGEVSFQENQSYRSGDLQVAIVWQPKGSRYERTWIY